MSDLYFDEASHRYYIGGEQVLSVTQSLEGAGLINYPNTPTMDWYKSRGTLIHDATELIDKDIFDWHTVPDEVEPFLEQYEAARADLKFRVKEWEVKVSHPTLRYGGRVDKIATYQRRKIIIDVKTGNRIKEEMWHHLQTAGYRETFKTKPRAYILYLSPEDYRWIEMDERAPIAWVKLVKGINAARSFCAMSASNR